MMVHKFLKQHTKNILIFSGLGALIESVLFKLNLLQAFIGNLIVVSIIFFILHKN